MKDENNPDVLRGTLVAVATQRDELKTLLTEWLADFDEEEGGTPQQNCAATGYCPDLGYPEEDWCFICRVRKKLEELPK